MFRHPLIIVLVLIVKETNADFWCPKNILECLVNCLFQCDQIVTDEIEQIRCRIECAKENYCIRKPWDLLNKKMALARRSPRLESTTARSTCRAARWVLVAEGGGHRGAVGAHLRVEGAVLDRERRRLRVAAVRDALHLHKVGPAAAHELGVDVRRSEARRPAPRGVVRGELGVGTRRSEVRTPVPTCGLHGELGVDADPPRAVLVSAVVVAPRERAVDRHGP